MYLNKTRSFVYQPYYVHKIGLKRVTRTNWQCKWHNRHKIPFVDFSSLRSSNRHRQNVRSKTRDERWSENLLTLPEETKNFPDGSCPSLCDWILLLVKHPASSKVFASHLSFMRVFTKIITWKELGFQVHGRAILLQPHLYCFWMCLHSGTIKRLL